METNAPSTPQTFSGDAFRGTGVAPPDRQDDQPVPGVPPAAISIVSLLIIVPPVYVLAPVRIKVPVPVCAEVQLPLYRFVHSAQLVLDARRYRHSGDDVCRKRRRTALGDGPRLIV